MIQVGDPALNDVGQRTAFGLRPRGEVPHQFRVEVSGLPAEAVKPALEGDVRLSDDELALDCHHPCQVEEEALPGTVSSRR